MEKIEPAHINHETDYLLLRYPSPLLMYRRYRCINGKGRMLLLFKRNMKAVARGGVNLLHMANFRFCPYTISERSKILTFKSLLSFSAAVGATVIDFREVYCRFCCVLISCK